MFGEIYDIDRCVESIRIKEHCGSYEEEDGSYIVYCDVAETGAHCEPTYAQSNPVSFKTLEEAKAYLEEQRSNGFAKYLTMLPTATEVYWSIIRRDEYGVYDEVAEGVDEL